MNNVANTTPTPAHEGEGWAIDVHGLTKRYGQRVVVRDV